MNEIDAIKILKSIDDEASKDFSDAVEVIYKKYYQEILHIIFYQYASIEDCTNHAMNIFEKIVYSEEKKKSKIKNSYNPLQGIFRNWLITIVKNESKNQVAKQTSLGDKRIKENKIKLLVDILTARVSNEPVSTSRMGSLTDEEWNKIYKELYQDDPESNFWRKKIIDCVKKGLGRFRNEKVKNWRAAQFIMQEKSIKDIANELGKSVDNAKIFMSESRKKLKPYIEKCL